MSESHWNSKCPKCKKDCYAGLSKIECSNDLCENYKKPEFNGTKKIVHCQDECNNIIKEGDCTNDLGTTDISPFINTDCGDCFITASNGVVFRPECELTSFTFGTTTLYSNSSPKFAFTSGGGIGTPVGINSNGDYITYDKKESIADKLINKSREVDFALQHKTKNFSLSFSKEEDGWSLCKSDHINDYYFLGKDGKFAANVWTSNYKNSDYLFTTLEEAYNKLVEVMDFKFEDYE